MIIAFLKGGLGNQLYQYAFGRNLARIHNTVLKLDISDFQGDSTIPYYLSHFNIQENFASPEEIKNHEEVIRVYWGKS